MISKPSWKYYVYSFILIFVRYFICVRNHLLQIPEKKFNGFRSDLISLDLAPTSYSQSANNQLTRCLRFRLSYQRSAMNLYLPSE